MKEFNVELVKYAHTVGESGIHLQFTPAYRREVFGNPKVRKLLKLYLESKTEQMGVVLAGIGFGPEHLHLFVCGFKNYSIADLARHLKEFTSRMMRKNHWNLFKDQLWGKKFWSSGYFHRTVGAVTSETMEFYVKHSQDKHWKKVDYDIYKYQKEKQGNLLDYVN